MASPLPAPGIKATVYLVRSQTLSLSDPVQAVSSFREILRPHESQGKVATSFSSMFACSIFSQREIRYVIIDLSISLLGLLGYLLLVRSAVVFPPSGGVRIHR